MKPLEVHWRLMSRLPVRTIETRHKPASSAQVFSDRRPGEMRGRHEEQKRLYQRVMRMHQAGVERADIAEALNLSTGTVDKYIAGNLSNAAKAALRRL